MVFSWAFRYATESRVGDTTTQTPFPTRSFLLAAVLNTIWINLSEVFRYFAFVMPMMRTALAGVENAAPMDLGVFMIWGLWDTILVFGVTGFSWLFLDRFRFGTRNAVVAGTLFWLSVFVILWLGLFNMNLATPAILAVALPLALIEMLIAAAIVDRTMKPRSTKDA